MKMPSIQFLNQFRVVSTLQTAGSIARSQELDVHFDASHFFNVIIDEATFVPESVLMIAGTFVLFSFN